MPLVTDSDRFILWQVTSGEKRILGKLKHPTKKDTECLGAITRLGMDCYLVTNSRGEETRHKTEWQALTEIGYKLPQWEIDRLIARRKFDIQAIYIEDIATIQRLSAIQRRYRKSGCRSDNALRSNQPYVGEDRSR